ncbi:DUF4359 domain-containing protein [Candidatus Nitrospira bockiana]
MTNARLLGLVLVLAVCVGLAATNPTTEQYGLFLEQVLEEALSRMGGHEGERQAVIREILKTQGHKIIASLIRTRTGRRNYGLFSIFETRVGDVEVVVIGVGRHFIPRDDPQELAKKLGRLVL